MIKGREKLYQAYHTVLSMALTWALILVINQYFHLRVFLIVSAVYSLIPAVIIYLFNLNKRNAISYILLGSSIPALALIFWITKTNPIKWFSSLIEWCNIYDGSKELYIARYANTIVFAAACLATVVFFLLTRKQLAKIVLAVILFAALIIFRVNKIDSSKALICVCVFYILTIFVESYGIVKSHKAGRQEKKEGILYLAPICLLLALLAVSLPSKTEPIQWRAIKTAYKNLMEQIEVWKTDLNYYFGSSNREFFISMSGYSEESGELENKSQLQKDDKAALRISGLEKNQSVYLIGSVSDVYTGSSWEKSKSDYLPEDSDYFLDYVEMFYALSRQNIDVLQNNRFLERKAIKIIYNNIKTKTFFYPDKMKSYDIFSNYQKIKKQMPQISFAKARGKGTSYQAIYYVMNLQGEAFIQMLKDADTFSYQGPQSIDTEVTHYIRDNILTQNDSPGMLSKDYSEELGKRAESIKAQYTVLPEDLSDRVYELAEDITAGYDTKYEKLKAIESYLIKNYTYSLDPHKIPEGEDFIEYFLFENKSGYCTSYATAMAVLSRCIGIPTRYVEGYAAKFETQDKDNMYLVKNSCAHAWAEAYIEGIGWIPFEATTPFYDVRYTQWKEPSKGNSQASTPVTNPYENIVKPSQPLKPLTGDEMVKKDNYAEIFVGIIIFLVIIFVLVMALIIYYNVLRYRYKKEYERADYSRKMYMLFLRILKLLKREGFELGQQETILMLSGRVKDNFRYERVTFPEVANIFMRYRYAQEEVTKAEIDKVTVYHLGLADKERDEVSRFKIWIEELIFLTRKGVY